MADLRREQNLRSFGMILGIFLFLVADHSFSQSSEPWFATPFGENITYSDIEADLCFQMQERMEGSGFEKHPVLESSNFLEEICAGNPMLEKRVELCSRGDSLYAESCNRNFFGFLLAHNQCGIWIRFGTTTKESCAEELGTSYINSMFKGELIEHSRYLVGESVKDQIDELSDEKLQAFTDGYELGNTQTKEILDRWNATETDFLRQWDLLSDQSTKYYELAVALQTENTALRKRFREVIDEYENEMKKGQRSLQTLANQLANHQARQLVAEAERQRQRSRQSGLALMALGSSIASGQIGAMPRYSAPRASKTASTFKNCNYLVRGSSVSLPVSRSTPCPRNFSWGGNPATFTGQSN